MQLASYPNTRMRRTRQAKFIRNLVQENQLTHNDLIYPLFILPGDNNKQAIEAMPGIERLSIDLLLEEISELVDLKIPAVALFPMTDPNLRTACAKYAYDPEGLIQQAIRAIKQNFPQMGVIADVALDPYTLSGHDGLTDNNGKVLNDQTCEVLTKQALSLAQAGADIIAPSDMMDGRIGLIRNTLEENSFSDVLIMSYAAKYASNFYGPFRNAIGSDQTLGKQDKSSYQMDPANSNEAVHEVALDIQEGADLILIKPGMPYLDIIYRIKQQFKIPTFAYQVSGEYSMLQSAVKNGMLNEAAIIESLLSFKRAGANGIFTYFAKKIAKIL